MSPAGSVARRRVHEVDLLRGVAIIGMMIAHLGPWIDGFRLSEPATWWAAADGRPSATFAFLAGVSLVLMTRSAVETGGTAVVQTRIKLLTRGLILLLLGVFVIDLQGIIAGILTTYGVLFMLLAFVFRWRTRTVAWVLGVLIVGGPAVVAVLLSEEVPIYPLGPGFELLAGSYPLLAWLAYALGGLLLARLLEAAPSLWRWLLPTAVVAAVLLYVAPRITSQSLILDEYFASEPHTGGLVEVLSNLGLAVALLLLLGLLMRVPVARTLTYPVRAIGQMPLTIYVLHVMTAAAFLGGYPMLGGNEDLSWFSDTSAEGAGGDDVVFEAGADPGSAWSVNPWFLIGSLVVALVIASLWMRLFRRGPLEHLIYLAGQLASDLTSAPGLGPHPDPAIPPGLGPRPDLANPPGLGPHPDPAIPPGLGPRPDLANPPGLGPHPDPAIPPPPLPKTSDR